MELSPSWEVASCAAIQELTGILWNPKVYYFEECHLLGCGAV
jgi:hypothetical protein